jgi:hypothetical protein
MAPRRKPTKPAVTQNPIETRKPILGDTSFTLQFIPDDDDSSEHAVDYTKAGTFQTPSNSTNSTGTVTLDGCVIDCVTQFYFRNNQPVMTLGLRSDCLDPPGATYRWYSGVTEDTENEGDVTTATINFKT